MRIRKSEMLVFEKFYLGDPSVEKLSPIKPPVSPFCTRVTWNISNTPQLKTVYLSFQLLPLWVCERYETTQINTDDSNVAVAVNNPTVNILLYKYFKIIE